MVGLGEALQAHLDSGATTLCRCWLVTRRDDVVYGFTDHDMDLTFDGVTFAAGTGLTAKGLAQSTGLSVDNSEALGALSSTMVRESDIDAGRFDSAEVTAWLVNWADISQRQLLFRGTLGEIRRSGGAFEAELRGLTEALNQPQGRVFQKPCTAVLGGQGCGSDTTQPGYSAEVAVTRSDSDVFGFDVMSGYAQSWFTHGRLTVLSGAAAGLWSAIKRDDSDTEGRKITLWQPIRGDVAVGDLVRLTAGCDKTMTQCRLKFNNLLNFQGFPDIPGEDWMASVPRATGGNIGGSLR